MAFASSSGSNSRARHRCLTLYQTTAHYEFTISRCTGNSAMLMHGSPETASQEHVQRCVKMQFFILVRRQLITATTAIQRPRHAPSADIGPEKKTLARHRCQHRSSAAATSTLRHPLSHRCIVSASSGDEHYSFIWHMLRYQSAVQIYQRPEQTTTARYRHDHFSTYP